MTSSEADKRVQVLTEKFLAAEPGLFSISVRNRRLLRVSCNSAYPAAPEAPAVLED